MGIFFTGRRQWLKMLTGIILALLAILILIVAINMLSDYGVDFSIRGENGENGETPFPTTNANNELENNDNDKLDEETNSTYSDHEPESEAEHIPLFEVLGTDDLEYLRSEPRAFYFGYDDHRGGWHADQELSKTDYRGEELKIDAEALKTVEKRVEVKPIKSIRGYIPVGPNTKQLSAPLEDIIYFPERQSFFSSSNITDKYNFIYIPSDHDPELLKTIDWQHDYEDANRYFLEYHTVAGHPLDEFKSDIFDLDHTEISPYEAIIEVSDYLKTNYQFTEPFIRSDKFNKIVQFLLKERAGCVMDFNSSLALLTRELELPSRIVFGFRIEPEENYQVVYTSQSYAYTEIYFAHLGWISFDAVPDYHFYQPPEETETRIIEVEEAITKGETLSISGEVTDRAGNAVDDLLVLIYLQENPDIDRLSYSKTTLSEGSFTTKFSVDRDISTGPAHVIVKTLENDRYRSSKADLPLSVHSETIIDLLLPQMVYEGSNLHIQGRLTELIEPIPLVFERISLHLETSNPGNHIASKHTLTNREGAFELELTADFIEPDPSFFNLNFIERQPVKVSAYFYGNNYHFSSQADGDTTVWIFYWQRAVFVSVLLLVAGSGVFTVIKLRRKNEAAKEKDESENTFDKLIVPEKDIQLDEKVTKKHLLSVKFPEIDESLPPVWGVNETLMIEISKAMGSIPTIEVNGSSGNNTSNGEISSYQVNNETDETAGKTIYGKKLKILFGDSNFEEFFLVDSTRFKHAFSIKGKYEISIIEPERNIVCGLSSLRIVDYREEIIDLGQLLFKQLMQSNSSLNEDLTPREGFETGLGHLLKSGKIEPQALNEMVKIYEYATYSLKKITRTDYETFYQLLITVKSILEE